MSELNQSSLRNQMYFFKYELRPKKKLPPTSLLHIKLHSIDKSTLEHCLVGHVVFPLFLDKTKMEPPNRDTTKHLIPLIGNF